MSEELFKGNFVVPSTVQDTATTLSTTLYQLGLTCPNSPSCTEAIHNPTTPCSGLQTPPSEKADAEADAEGQHGVESKAVQEDAEPESTSAIAHPGAEATINPIALSFSVTKSRIRLDISSDTTCPWCFITKRRISKAIQMFYALSSPEHETKRVRFDIHWHPYELNPQAPQIPIPKLKLYTRKFGPDQALLVRDRIMEAGKAEGMKFLPADQCLYCNTLNSHRLIKYARERLGRELLEKSFRSKDTSGSHSSDDSNNINNNSSSNSSENDDDGGQEEEIDEFGNMAEDAMVEELFQCHFQRGGCGDLPTLNECARNVLLAMVAEHDAAGNEPVDTDKIEREFAEIERYLATDEDLQEIKDEIRMAKQQMGIHGVPTIVVQNMYLLPGGQDSATFVEIFKRVV